MKKIYSILFCISLFTAIKAQQYYPMLDSVNTWHNITNFIPVRMQQPSQTLSNCSYPYYFNQMELEYTTSDTIINSQTYKIVLVESDWSPSTCLYGFIREDTAARKVFFKDNIGNPEILLYDFSMTLGSTMPMNFVNNYYFQNGTYTLDSITTIHIPAGFRRVFHLNNHAVSNGMTISWIESVGCYYDVFYPYCNYGFGGNAIWGCPGFDHNNIQYMTCFDHANKVYYDSCAYFTAYYNSCFDTQDTCDYFDICGSIHENTLISAYEVSPNPSSGNMILELSLNDAADVQLQLFDISGRELKKEIELGGLGTGDSQIPLNLSELANGTYFLKIIAAGHEVTTNVVISR